MHTKLTLDIEKEVVRKAKKYAKDQHVSLSTIVENHLRNIVQGHDDSSVEKNSIVDQLSGILKLKAEDDYKEIFSDLISEKYM